MYVCRECHLGLSVLVYVCKECHLGLSVIMCVCKERHLGLSVFVYVSRECHLGRSVLLCALLVVKPLSSRWHGLCVSLFHDGTACAFRSVQDSTACAFCSVQDSTACAFRSVQDGTVCALPLISRWHALCVTAHFKMARSVRSGKNTQLFHPRLRNVRHYTDLIKMHIQLLGNEGQNVNPCKRQEYGSSRNDT